MKEKDEFLHYFREIHLRFSHFYALILTEAELTLPQYALLNQLATVGAIPMTDASEKLHLTKPAVTHIVDCLEELKLLKRIPHQSDRRVNLLEIQSKGKTIVSHIQGRVFSYLMDVFNEFEPAERAIILKFHALIANTMDEFLTKSVEKKT